MTWSWSKLFLISTFLLLAWIQSALAQEDETRFKAAALSGSVTVFHDERDETVRMKVGDHSDDGDNISTGAKSEAWLRLPGKGYIYLGPRTKVHISRLRAGDKGLQVRLNLLTGELWCQLDKTPKYLFEISAKNLIVRCHGTLVEAVRQKDAVRVTAFDGSIVTVAHAKVKLAKTGEVVQYIHDQFRYKHRLKASDDDRLAQWKAQFTALQEKNLTKTH
jgi:ferric-dicitrate binding protein FerR (iron transport regulator)